MSDESAGANLLDLRVRELIAAVADERQVPGAGSVVALTTAFAAALVVMAAHRSSETWPDAPGVKAQAAALLKRSAALVSENARVYEQALRVLRGETELRGERRDYELGNALASAAQVPLAIAELAADVALLASAVTEAGEPATRADAAAAAVLAEAAARGAANLVFANLTVTGEDERARHAEQLVVAATQAAAHALEPSG